MMMECLLLHYRLSSPIEKKNEIPPLSKGRNTARQICTKFVIAIIVDEVNAHVMIIALVFRCGQGYGGRENSINSNWLWADLSWNFKPSLERRSPCSSLSATLVLGFG